MPAPMLPTVTGWPSAVESCAASAVRTASCVNTARAQKNRPIDRTATTRPPPTRVFFSMECSRLGDELIGRCAPTQQRSWLVGVPAAFGVLGPEGHQDGQATRRP